MPGIKMTRPLKTFFRGRIGTGLSHRVRTVFNRRDPGKKSEGRPGSAYSTGTQ